jgi:hypothetical protein
MEETVDKDYIVKVSGETQEFPTGARRDKQTGKGRYDLISVFALQQIARIYEAGSITYGVRNYERGMPLSRFLDSALRHICQCIEGQDDENHAAQAAWNIMGFIHIRELIARGILPKELNDLPNYKPRLSCSCDGETSKCSVCDEKKP